MQRVHEQALALQPGERGPDEFARDAEPGDQFGLVDARSGRMASAQDFVAKTSAMSSAGPVRVSGKRVTVRSMNR